MSGVVVVTLWAVFVSVFVSVFMSVFVIAPRTVLVGMTVGVLMRLCVGMFMPMFAGLFMRGSRMNSKLDPFNFGALLALKMHVEIAQVQLGKLPFQRGGFYP